MIIGIFYFGLKYVCLITLQIGTNVAIRLQMWQFKKNCAIVEKLCIMGEICSN